MAHAKRADGGEHPKLDMTPMIDVVFQLLIFFAVAIKQDDILSKLTAARPDGYPTPEEKQLPLVNIAIAQQGFMVNDAPVRPAELDRLVGQLAAVSRTATVVIRCAADSPHGLLVQALDICSKHRMANLSVFSQ